jgi:hypothetical protein
MVEFSKHKEIIDGWFAGQGNPDMKALRFKKILEYLTELDNIYSIAKNVEDSNSLLSNSIEIAKSVNNETSAKISEMEQLISENQSILDAQIELNSKFETLQTIQKTIEGLKIKKSEIEKPENAIDDLNNEISRIDAKIIDKLNDYITQLKALNEILVESSSTLEQEASNIINQSISNIEAISNKQFSMIDKLSNEPVKTIYQTFDERIANLTSEYNLYVEKIESIKNDLDLIENKHSNIVESFKLHELENERVFGNLRKIGEMDGVNVYVETLIREIKDKLTDFDNNIKKLIYKKKELPLFERI